MLVRCRTEKGADLTFGHSKANTFHGLDHIRVFHFKSDAQFPQNIIIIDRRFGYFGSWAIARATAF